MLMIHTHIYIYICICIPIIILYEISIFAVRIVEKKRQKEDATAEGELSNDKDLHTT